MILQARYLQYGDIISSGETVMGTWPRPNNQVLVLLERNGQQRSAIWGAATTIGVRREVHDQGAREIGS